MTYSTGIRNAMTALVFLGVILTMACDSGSSGEQRMVSVPDNMVGSWMDSVVKITVRTEPRWMKFEFTKDTASILMNVSKEGMVSGHIGQAKFEGKCRKNSGNPEKTGIAYIVKCGRIGKIFDQDPLDDKEVEIWLSPVRGQMGGELRFTEGGAKFPMAGMVFNRNN